VFESVFKQPKSQKAAILLAAMGAVTPLAGLHKFYLGRPGWGVAYLLLSWTPIPHVASAIEAVWYLVQDGDRFQQRFSSGQAATVATSDDTAERVAALAEALRELDRLRADGLLSEHEFEQKRRRLIERLG